jgi:hypothetical protein
LRIYPKEQDKTRVLDFLVLSIILREKSIFRRKKGVYYEEALSVDFCAQKPGAVQRRKMIDWGNK